MTACESVEELSESDTLDSDISLREGLTGQNWVPSNPMEDLVEWVHIDFCAADKPEDLSVKFYYGLSVYTAFLGPEEDAEAEDWLIADEKGFVFVVECLARGFVDRIKLNTVVTTIQRDEDCVCATRWWEVLWTLSSVLVCYKLPSEEMRMRFVLTHLSPQKKKLR